MDTLKHWTSKSTHDFVYRISSDFVAQLETKLEEKELGRRAYADLLGLTPGRVSQVLNDPGSLNLTSMVQYALPLGMKVAIVAYDDGDHANQFGPISSQVFATCWQQTGQPRSMFEATTSTSSNITCTVATGNSPIVIRNATFSFNGGGSVAFNVTPSVKAENTTWSHADTKIDAQSATGSQRRLQ